MHVTIIASQRETFFETRCSN